MRTYALILVVALFGWLAAPSASTAPPACYSPALHLTPDYAYAVGSANFSDPDGDPGIPVFNPQPPSTLLPPGATSFDLSVESIANTTCAYSVNAILPYASMTPFTQGAGARFHSTSVVGLNPNPSQVNHVYVRCASHPDYLLHQIYRLRAEANPAFPRTGNLWGWWDFLEKGAAYMARIDLWLGADLPPELVRELRQLNPDILILTSINAVENGGLPDDYYLKDVNGNRIEVWPGSFRLNLTKAYVAEYQAHFAYQQMLDGEMMYDGVFFDNVMTTQSWLTEDIYGNSVQIDANEDGLQDDPDVLDAAWKAGVFHEMNTFRQLMPYAIVSGHSMNIWEPGIAEIANGVSIGFLTADVLEGEMGFPTLWSFYHDWLTQAQPPAVTMIESSPMDQIAYGYDYSPWEKIPPATLEFARTFYPYVRFGLALTLMGDGYFAHEYGDTWHGNDWWYDELDFDLGYPLGPAQRLPVQGFDPGPNRIQNGSFESAIGYPWNFWADEDQGCTASVSRDTSTAKDGVASARVDIAATSGVDWHIEFAQYDRALQQSQTYDLTFWAKSDVPRPITLSAQKGSPDWDNYGLWQTVPIGIQWQQYTVSFEANATVNDARIQFLLGEQTGAVWLDDVRLSLHPPDVYKREYTHGMALLNATRQPQQVNLGAGWQRLSGNQAPRLESILDDGGPHFTACSNCATAAYDSGEWKASGPFYHNWGEGVHQVPGSGGMAEWYLPIDVTDVYTVSAWWPAAPQAAGWSNNVIYRVMVNGQVLASATFDQRSGGDQWHTIAALQLSPSDHPVVRMSCPGSAPCIADALYLRSRGRYNDGSPVASLTLNPMDGIVLRRSLYWLYLPLILRR